MRLDAGTSQVPREELMPRRGPRELKIRVVLRLDAVLERTGMGVERLREAIASDGFPSATELNGREVWDMDAVNTWCRDRGTPLPVKYQAALDRFANSIAHELVREYREEIKAFIRRERR